MNPELHHKWNAERTADRESGKQGSPILKETVDQNKVMLKQNKPR
jgi:hypothetical protein